MTDNVERFLMALVGAVVVIILVATYWLGVREGLLQGRCEGAGLAYIDHVCQLPAPKKEL